MLSERFGLWLVLAGLVLIPCGFSVPWAPAGKVSVVVVVFAAMLWLSVRALSAGLVHRSSTVKICLAAWMLINLLLGLMVDSAPGAGLSVLFGAIASLPLIGAGFWFLTHPDR